MRGYYYGQALTIKHRGRSLSAEQKEAASSEGSGGDKESKSAPEYVESSPGGRWFLSLFFSLAKLRMSCLSSISKILDVKHLIA